MGFPRCVTSQMSLSTPPELVIPIKIHWILGWELKNEKHILEAEAIPQINLQINKHVIFGANAIGILKIT